MSLRRNLADLDISMYYPEAHTATIANAASLSDAVDLDGTHPVALITPAAWTTAVITFQVSYDGTTFNDFYDSNGGEYTVQAAASRHIYLNPPDFASVRAVKLRSGTSGTPVAQGAQRLVTVVSRSL